MPTHADEAFFDAGRSPTASARLALPAPCGVPRLRCTALGSVATGSAGFTLTRDAPRTTVRDTMLGMRFDFPDTRSAAHGPWFIQFKVTRRSAAIKSWMPIPRHRAATLTLGTEF